MNRNSTNREKSIERNKKYSIVKEFFKDKRRTKPYAITLNRIQGSPVNVGEYFFFFRGKGNDLKLKSILKRIDQRKSCSFLPNGQPSNNMRRIRYCEVITKKYDY